jgi:hypothetical protein
MGAWHKDMLAVDPKITFIVKKIILGSAAVGSRSGAL